VVTEAKYGFSCRDGTLGVSLLRSPSVTGAELHHERMFPPSLRRGTREKFSDQGRHVIRLALCFQSPETERENLAPMLADTLFTPALSYAGPAVSAGLLGLDGLESVIPTWAKPAANGKGWILRLHETMGRRGTIQLRLAEGLRAWKTDLSEASNDADSCKEIAITPYEVISLHLR
jgi:alpha-mannosidase